MASKIKVDQIEGSTGSSITIPSGQTLTITDGLASSTITSGTFADARIPNLNASKINAGTIPVARGGTGLTSLGSAGQAIKVNSGGNALEFGTISSDFVKLANHESTNNTASVSFDGYFSSDYDTYIVKMSVVDDSWIKFRFNVGGSTHTGGNWNWTSGRFYRTSSSNGSDNSGNFNDSWFPVFYHGLTNSVIGNAELVIHMPQYAGKYKTVYSNTSNYSGSNHMLREDGAGYFHGTTGALSGFTLLTANGNNFDVLSMQLYGLKK